MPDSDEQGALYEILPPQDNIISPEHRAVIDEYFNGTYRFNKTRAYLAVFGGEYKNAAVRAHFLFMRPEIKKEIDDRFAEFQISKNEALSILAEQARAKLTDFAEITPDGQNYQLKLIDEEGKIKSAAAIKKVKITKKVKKDQETGEYFEQIETELELYDSQVALDKILKVQGAYTDNLNVNVRAYRVELDEEDE